MSTVSFQSKCSQDNLRVDESKSMIYPLNWLILDYPEWNESLEVEDSSPEASAHAKPLPQTLKNGYLVTPKRIQNQKAVNSPWTSPLPSSSCVLSRSYKHYITLTENVNACFFCGSCPFSHLFWHQITNTRRSRYMSFMIYILKWIGSVNW